jgi:hypothetical protein
MGKQSAQAEEPKQSDTVILVSKYANHRILEHELDAEGKYVKGNKILLDLKFRNGICIKSRSEFEALKQNPAFAKRLGKTIGVKGETSIQAKGIPIPKVVQNARGSDQ